MNAQDLIHEIEQYGLTPGEIANRSGLSAAYICQLRSEVRGSRPGYKTMASLIALRDALKSERVAA
jgi:hypothetical protein